MGWQDRPYSSAPGGGGSNFNWQNLLFGSFSLGRWQGIHIRVHSSLLLLVIFNVLFSGIGGGPGLWSALISSLILFVIVLLHEFGHCFAARAVGGNANEVLLWPLGGLAFVDTPRRPWPSFVATAGGPLVNVVICLVTGGLLLVMSGGNIQLPLNPLIPFGGAMMMNQSGLMLISTSSIAYYLWWIFVTSWTLLFFNLLPIFPLDGGQLLQAALWPKMGYVRSMNLACSVGMVGAVLMGLWGIASGNLWLLVLAFAGFMTCRQTQMSVGDYAGSSYQAPSYTPKRPNAPHRRGAARPKDDKFSLRDLNPLERIARARRRKQFERLMKDD